MKGKTRVLHDAPQLDSLVVNQKKVAEVRAWMATHLKSASILILTGPPGCGKTTLVKTIASVDSIVLKEVEDHTTFRLEDDKKPLDTIEKLRRWILCSSQMFSLFGGDWRRSIVLYEEGGITDWFVEVFVDYVRSAKIPLIVTGNESMKNNINKLLDTDPLNEDFVSVKQSITYISLNAIPPTSIKKCLKGVVPEMVDTIVESCNGDLRVALNTKQIVATNKTFAKVVAKNEAVNFFHLIGRIIHTEPIKNQTTKRFELKHSPSDVARELCGREHIMPLLEHNAISTINELSHVAYVEHYMSLADVFHNFAFNRPFMDYSMCAIAVGAIMVVPNKKKIMLEVSASEVNRSNVAMAKKGIFCIEQCRRCLLYEATMYARCNNLPNYPFNVETDTFCAEVLPFINALQQKSKLAFPHLESLVKTVNTHSTLFLFV
ncbi:cell cycle checkpoint protein rad17, putative [Entamoeba invadens IP1]|uniref:Cell cycle checkpoint protein rad17, putative n=1 Tax=Entamoeba invadens IP1 TaxID=370355 RepID=A0A0A1UCU2_ENTIV|nr:cell cycle checkpoint protein rad17, putative [Entamoeba invadens IP1]ELP90114.1 cell cycle checkpoint protein rad17, putative [Entamoeba invadens IP1]|eukprot:XP_004256885.1 cell cycle checkpoint protein rad17, putative [Entamoeba invadens IP1]